MSHHIEQLDARTWKIVEDDPYGQYPFMYLIRGKDKVVVIDTGCGVGDVRKVVDSLNQPPLPVIVVCTHVHFDVRDAHLCPSAPCSGRDDAAPPRSTLVGASGSPSRLPALRATS